MPDANWLAVVQRLRTRREPGVLITVAAVRGHAPRNAGAKMVVSSAEEWGSIGGGNLEAVAVERARAMLSTHATTPELFTTALSDKTIYQHGRQCCGGKVTALLEPLPVPPAVAIFGIGHIGLELARILARHDLELHLIDSRPAQLTDQRLSALADPIATIHVHHAPLLPEIVLGELPSGTHILIMTHDHAEDAALCDAVLREGDYGSIGLIGSTAKWARFQRRLATEGGHPADTIARITTPIGTPTLTGKQPATIALSVATALLHSLEHHINPERTNSSISGP